MTTLTVVVPVLNEEEFLGSTLEALQHQTRPPDEILVIDGGSDDRTVEIARDCGVTVISSERGRKLQMNLGARMARSDFVLFCHGDTICASDLVARVIEAIEKHELVGGGCVSRYSPASPGMRLVAGIGNLASRYSKMFGSSRLLFLKRDLFISEGGCDPRSAEEGYDISGKVGCHGKMRLVPAIATASARRFEGRYWKVFWIWFLFIGSAVFGIPGKWAEDLFY